MNASAPHTLARPPWYRRWAWVAVLVTGVITYLIVLQTMIDTGNPTFFPSLLLVGSATVPVSVLVLASGGREPVVPLDIVALTALFGGLIGTVAAGVLEYATLHRLSVLPMTAVGLIEETVKLIVPLALLLVSHRVRNPAAGIIIGVASGTGFAVLETMGYGFNALLQSRSLAEVDGTLLLRALLAPAGHVAWTGLVCAALWHWRFGGRTSRGLLALIGAFVAAVALHALWDGSDVLAIHIGVIVVSVSALAVIIHRVHRRAATETNTQETPSGAGNPDAARVRE